MEEVINSIAPITIEPKVLDRRISQRKATKQKRKKQTCRIYEVKIDQSKLSNATLKHLSQLFKEAKWFYNYCLSQKDINDSDTTIKSVPVKVVDKYEERTFSVLSSQMKQAIKTRIFNSLVALSVLKKNGHKVGRLKFKGLVNSIPLKQYDKTYSIDKDNSRIKIQGLKDSIKVLGLGQIPEEAEIANAVLVRKASGYFIHITTYTEKVIKVVPEESVGVDFGCQTQMTFSDGTKVEFQVPISKRLRKLDRKIMRRGKKANSNNKRKDQAKRRKEYEKITNKKADIRHKIVSAIIEVFKYVCFQDESIHAWHAGNHGKKVQNSGIGGIIADLKNKSQTPLEVDKFFPSTQMCPCCGVKHKLGLDERIYTCPCGFVYDRDIKSAGCIEMEGMKQVKEKEGVVRNNLVLNYVIPKDVILTDHKEFTLGENPASTFFDTLSKINGIKASKLVR